MSKANSVKDIPLPRPLGVLVLVEEIEANERTPGGVLLPQAVNDKLFIVKGRVLAMGEGRWNELHGKYEPLPLEVGDQVIFIKSQTYEWKDPDTRKEYFFVNSGNMLAVLPGRD